MWLLPLLACSPAAIEVGPGTTYADNGEETDTALDSGDTAAGTDTGDPPDPVTDFSTFTNSVRFIYEGWGISCDETITGVGTELASTDAMYSALAADCTTCQHFYAVQASQDTVCTVIPVGTTYRAIFTSGALGVSYIYADDGRGGVYQVASAQDGTFDGANLAYQYTFNFYGVDIATEETDVFPMQ